MDIQKLITLIEKRELLKPGQKGSFNCVIDDCKNESKFSRGEGIRKSLCESHKNQLPVQLKQQFTNTSQLMCQICNTSRANYKNNTTGKYDRCKKCLDKELNPSNWNTIKSNKCHYPDCTKEARYGLYMVNGIKMTRKDAVMCSSHKLSEYVDLTVRLCQGYNNEICNQSKGKPATAKFVHKDEYDKFKSESSTVLKSKKPVPTHCLKCIPNSEKNMYINIETIKN